MQVYEMIRDKVNPKVGDVVIFNNGRAWFYGVILVQEEKGWGIRYLNGSIDAQYFITDAVFQDR